MHTQIKTQVLVLGSGPGGYSAAFRCAELGIDTTIVERYSSLGGVCLNVGCIPSKTLLYIAKLIKTYQNPNLNKCGILIPDQINFDINKIRFYKNDIISKISCNLNSMSKSRNIKIIHGVGEFFDEHTLKISNDQDDLKVIFEYAIIATGSQPISLSFMPNDQRIWNSTAALSLKLIPKHLLIIGSGAIGLEMATIYHALGSKIDLVEAHDQILPIADSDIVNFFLKSIKKHINLITHTTIKSVNSREDGIYAFMQNNINTTANVINNTSNNNTTNRYDAILTAIGRTPNSKHLNLKKIKVFTDNNGFILVDNQMRTNIPNIFAIGDVIGHPMLAHKSAYEGRIVAEIIGGKKYYFNCAKVIPSIVYSDPEIAWVGYTEKEAQIKNINYSTSIFPWTSLGKSIASDCTEGVTKLIFDKKTHRIIGGSVLGSHASEIIGEIALAIEMGCDVEDMVLTIHAHPTLYESIELAASIYHKRIKI